MLAGLTTENFSASSKKYFYCKYQNGRFGASGF
jgi:hypothetical protein